VLSVFDPFDPLHLIKDLSELTSFNFATNDDVTFVAHARKPPTFIAVLP